MIWQTMKSKTHHVNKQGDNSSHFESPDSKTLLSPLKLKFTVFTRQILSKFMSLIFQSLSQAI